MTSHLQALAVVVQNWPVCLECRDLKGVRCPDPWFHQATATCPTCDSLYEIRMEHNAECPNREIRVLAQTHRALQNMMSLSQTPSSESFGDEPNEERNEEPDEESFGEESDEESFDEADVENTHQQICEWCSPFHPNCCDGLRMCPMMAGYENAKSCGRTTYLCKHMPNVRPVAMSLQSRIVALASVRHGMSFPH